MYIGPLLPECLLLHCSLASCGAVYCNRSCLWVCTCVFVAVCYHDNSKLRASILTKLGLLVKVVTISSRLNFGHPAPTGRGSAAGRKFLAPPYYSQRAVFASPVSASFIFVIMRPSSLGGGRILRRTLSVCPSVPLWSVIWRHLANYNDTLRAA